MRVGFFSKPSDKLGIFYSAKYVGSLLLFISFNKEERRKKKIKLFEKYSTIILSIIAEILQGSFAPKQTAHLRSQPHKNMENMIFQRNPVKKWNAGNSYAMSVRTVLQLLS